VVNIPGKGIVLSGGGQNLVQGNWVGIDPATGEAAPTEEAGIGILDGSSGNVIGVTCIPGDVPCQFGGERNIVSGNNGAGVAVYGGSGNLIRGNLIGTNASATEPVPNLGEGVAISGGIATQLGSTVSGHGNVISGNGGPGVLINREAGNQDQTVVTGNVIANNGAPGIVILSGENIPILGNSIYGNLRLGIDLGADGPTENDPSDADQGANRLQNSPQLEAAVAVQGGVFISGMATTEASNVPIRVEFFRNAPCSATNETPQARDLVHVFTGLSNADGVVTFQENVAQGLSLGDGVTATATASLIGEVGTRRNTSEISNCTTVIPSQ
jgi:parallel beta-helix repeat protein